MHGLGNDFVVIDARAAATEAVVARAERPSVPLLSVVTAKTVPVWLAVLVSSPAMTT